MKITYRNAVVQIRPQVYEPAEDSFLLAEAALSEIKECGKVLEMGCGSGMISAVIRANTEADIIGIDINPHAVKCTKDNGIEAIRGDLFNCIKGKFDIIIFNPPYLPTCEEEKEKGWLNVALDGGNDGSLVINRFLEQVDAHLKEKGRFLLLISSLTGKEKIIYRIRSKGYYVEEKMHEKLSFEQLTVLLIFKQ
ncbi:MAG: methyltransferase [Candidatus Methanoperedens sp.]|nr:methyltransferase [Candidatus Methanoperedens sp.]MCE8425284.1 methyltransferase [Candidatus Methanoperedens sp.]MCE8427805.1 methyltransferase [Candidatus Methanoperedens sp.]